MITQAREGPLFASVVERSFGRKLWGLRRECAAVAVLFPEARGHLDRYLLSVRGFFVLRCIIFSVGVGLLLVGRLKLIDRVCLKMRSHGRLNSPFNLL